MSVERRYEGLEPIRINKWLAQQGICSRREADKFIASGFVSVDGARTTDPGSRINPGQTLSLADKAGRRLDNQLSVVLNKPEGYVSGTPEADEVPAVRLIKRENLVGRAHAVPGHGNRLAPLGRLDKESRGLLILSEDGVLAKALVGPASLIDKEYRVRVRGEVTPERLRLLRHGLSLDNRALKPAKVELRPGNLLIFVLNEGRKRQIRRMCQLVGLHVVDLERVRIGPLKLGDLPEGKWRLLSERERAALIEASRSTTPVSRPRKTSAAAASPGAKPAAGPKAYPLMGEVFRRTRREGRRRSPVKPSAG